MKSFNQLLREATGVKKFYGYFDIPSLLRKLGWNAIGTGAFATAWNVPGKPYIVKVWEIDSAYRDFIRYCLKHRSNPHLPKIMGTLKSIPAFHARAHLDTMINFVKLEKLEPLKESSFSFSDMQFIEKLINTAEYDKEYSPELLRRLDFTYPYLKDLAFTILDLARNKPSVHTEDLHWGNFMQRADGTIVITDPWMSEFDYNDLTARERDTSKRYKKPYYLEKEDDNTEEDDNTDEDMDLYL